LVIHKESVYHTLEKTEQDLCKETEILFANGIVSDIRVYPYIKAGTARREPA
jgi:hypothetical protein